jgi:hypothetical protein
VADRGLDDAERAGRDVVLYRTREVPPRMKVSAPILASSSTAMAGDGPPIPVEATDAFSPPRNPVQVSHSRFKATLRGSSKKRAIGSRRPGAPGRNP